MRALTHCHHARRFTPGSCDIARSMGALVSLFSRSPTFEPLTFDHTLSCSSVLTSTIDRPPIRSPFAVMDFIASMAANKTFVEIGSRNGDLIECVSHVTRSAASIEADKRYCKTLAQRAAESGGRWTSTCALFSANHIAALKSSLAAQYYFAWVPQHIDVEFLANFQTLQRRNEIPLGATITLGFSGRNHIAEYLCYRAIRRFAIHRKTLNYSEALPGESQEEAVRRRRAGTCHLATFRPYTLDMQAVQKATVGICHNGSAIRAIDGKHLG